MKTLGKNAWKVFFGLITDEKGVISSKRWMAVTCGFCLCYKFLTSKTESPQLTDAVLYLALGCFGITAIDNLVNKRKPADDKTKPEDDESIKPS